MIVIKKNFMVFVCMAVCLGSLGQSKKPQSPVKSPAQKTAKAAVPKSENSLLWEVTGNGLKQPSYLFGTMHVLCADDAKLSENLTRIIHETGQIYFEIDMDNMKDMFSAIKYLRMNDGKKISDLISEADYKKVKHYFDSTKMPLPFAMLDRFKPYFVSGMIGEKILDCDQTNGMEQLIMAEAKKNDKEIFGLETVEFQASIFDSIPYDKQAKELVSYVDSIASYKTAMKELSDAYRKQDLVKLEELIEKSDPGMEDYMDILLYARNRRWIDPMRSAMFDKSTLFAIGAGHLLGEKGIIQLLKNKGYKLRPLPN